MLDQGKDLIPYWYIICIRPELWLSSGNFTFQRYLWVGWKMDHMTCLFYQKIWISEHHQALTYLSNRDNSCFSKKIPQSYLVFTKLVWVPFPSQNLRYDLTIEVRELTFRTCYQTKPALNYTELAYKKSRLDDDYRQVILSLHM